MRFAIFRKRFAASLYSWRRGEEEGVRAVDVVMAGFVLVFFRVPVGEALDGEDVPGCEAVVDVAYGFGAEFSLPAFEAVDWCSA